MTTERQKRRNASCVGKVPHPNPQAAARHRDNLKRRFGDGGLEVYRCQFCKRWHLGHGKASA